MVPLSQVYTPKTVVANAVTLEFGRVLQVAIDSNDGFPNYTVEWEIAVQDKVLRAVESEVMHWDLIQVGSA